LNKNKSSAEVGNNGMNRSKIRPDKSSSPESPKSPRSPRANSNSGNFTRNTSP